MPTTDVIGGPSTPRPVFSQSRLVWVSAAARQTDSYRLWYGRVLATSTGDNLGSPLFPITSGQNSLSNAPSLILNLLAPRTEMRSSKKSGRGYLSALSMASANQHNEVITVHSANECMGAK